MSRTTVTGIELAVSANIAQDVTLEIGKLTEVVEVAANTVAVATADAQVNCRRDHERYRHPAAIGAHADHARYLPAGRADLAERLQRRRRLQLLPHQRHAAGQQQQHPGRHRRERRRGAAPRPVPDRQQYGFGGRVPRGDRRRQSGIRPQRRRPGGTDHPLGHQQVSRQPVRVHSQHRRSTPTISSATKSGVAKPMFIQNMLRRLASAAPSSTTSSSSSATTRDGARTSRSRATAPSPRTWPSRASSSGLAAAHVQQYNILNADPLHKGIDPTIATLLKIYPSPNNNDVGDGLNSAGYRFNNPANSLEDQFTIKARLQPEGQPSHLLPRRAGSATPPSTRSTAPMPISPASRRARRAASAGEWPAAGTGPSAPSMVNEFRYGHQSATADFNPAGPRGGTDVHVQPAGPCPSTTRFRKGRNSPVNEYTDNLTKIHGNHTFKLGGNIRFTNQYGYNDAGIYPNASLSTTATGQHASRGTAGGPEFRPSSPSSRGCTTTCSGRVGSVAQTFYSDLNTWQAAGHAARAQLHVPRVRLLRAGRLEGDPAT